MVLGLKDIYNGRIRKTVMLLLLSLNSPERYPVLPPFPHTHRKCCFRCNLRTSYCSPLLSPLLLNVFSHLPLDLYTFLNRGHLLTITASRGPIVPFCYKSSVYTINTHTHTHIPPTDVGLQCNPTQTHPVPKNILRL